MRKPATRALMAVGAALTLWALVWLGTRRRKVLRRFGERMARQARHQAGRLEGLRYRMRGGRPDPDVPDTVLADRIRSSLGPLAARLDLPRVHVMVENRVALLHGEVGSAEEAAEIEQAAAAVSGVRGVESHLHIGLAPGDTRPSEGARHTAPSEALRRLVDAARRTGVDEERAPGAVRAVLTTFIARLPEVERDQLTAHLPEDVRELATPPREVPQSERPRTVHELVEQVLSADGVPPRNAQSVVAAVLGALRTLVPEEEDDVTAVLPAGLKDFWQHAT